METLTAVVVEDEEDIVELVRYNLEQAGFRVEAASTGEEGLILTREVKPDVVLLDLMLPGLDGLEVCRRLQNQPDTRAIPIVMVTARGEESDVVTGLELGAHDYICKPFRPRELVARVQAAVRHARERTPGEGSPIDAGGLRIHPGRHEVIAAGERIELTATEFKILHFLARHPGWVFTRQQIVDAVRGPDYPVTDRAVDVQILGLRRKLGDHAHLIETVRGVGYRFKE